MSMNWRMEDGWVCRWMDGQLFPLGVFRVIMLQLAGWKDADWELSGETSRKGLLSSHQLSEWCQRVKGGTEVSIR